MGHHYVIEGRVLIKNIRGNLRKNGRRSIIWKTDKEKKQKSRVLCVGIRP